MMRSRSTTFRRTSKAVALAALPAMVAICAFASVARAAGPPNVLLLTLDTTRADALGAFGGPSTGKAARTPGLDALAARGVRFTQAIASTPLTLPAHTSLFTGLAPPEHGVEVNGTTALASNMPTLAGAFSSRGYATAGFVASRVLDRRFGLARGFGHYDDRVHDESTQEVQPGERSAREMTDAALEWLKKRPTGKPLFLWVHYYDPHSPYRPAGADSKTSTAEAYAGEVAAMDREIGRLLIGLAEKEGKPAEVRALLVPAVAAGVQSPSIVKKLAEIEGKAGVGALRRSHLSVLCKEKVTGKLSSFPEDVQAFCPPL